MKLCPNSISGKYSIPIGVFEKGMSKKVVYIDGNTDLHDSDTIVRVANKCHTNKCLNWEDNKCSLPSLFLSAIDDIISNQEKCMIKDSCRWFAQEGGRICLKCPLISTREMRSF